MFKKIALAAALAATASFATWDKFPVLENHRGEADVGIEFLKQGEGKALMPNVGVRYTVMPNLELALGVPFLVMNKYGDEDGDKGVLNPIFMARYQFKPTMNAFLDLDIPVGTESINNEAWTFHFGVQYSQKFGMVNFGSQLGLQLETEGDDKATPPWTMDLGLEGDFEVGGPVTPYVGADIKMLIGKVTYDGVNGDESYTGDMGIFPYVGFLFTINPMISVDVLAQFGFGKETVVGPETPITIDAVLKIAF